MPRFERGKVLCAGVEVSSLQLPHSGWRSSNCKQTEQNRLLLCQSQLKLTLCIRGYNVRFSSLQISHSPVMSKEAVGLAGKPEKEGKTDAMGIT